jgi:hypothetical protein
MGMRKTAIVALVAMAWAGAPLLQGVSFAQPAPAAMATVAMASSLSPADKEALAKKLDKARRHFKFVRKGWSQEPNTQAVYDRKIDEVKALQAKLQNGVDFPLSDVDKAVAPPKGGTPY